MRSRRGFTLRTLVTAAALFCLLPATNALAGETNGRALPDDPLTYNIPYVAWEGEEVRLVKCVPGTINLDAEWAIVDSSVRQRSGDLRDPVFFDDTDRRTSPFAGTGEQAGRTCWAIDVDSVNPGMTRIKMALDDVAEPDRLPGWPYLKHDFLVIWLSMNTPALEELSNASFPGLSLGDPTGDGMFFPPFGRGLVRATVTGSFTDLHGSTWTLPNDWPTLANRYAYDTEDRNPMAWDIHDDQADQAHNPVTEHTATSICGGTASIDEVDNCIVNALGEIGPFSRLIGGTFPFTIGPFDPVRPNTSYLLDGKLDAGDAPMPAARLDLALNGNVGSIEAADKHQIYSRNRTGSNTAHNLYAPFYAAFIPATILAPSYTASGVHGTLANNFPGFQPSPIGPVIYHYWDLINARETRNRANVCVDLGGTGQFPNGFGLSPNSRNRATVYTDEHGEALFWFNPDVGALLVANNQGLCDLGEVGAGPEELGRATIQVEGRDPFQPVFDDRRLSNTLTKVVFELAGKSLDCYPKNDLEVLCVETITDIYGRPVVGAPVEFSREPLGVIQGVVAPGINIPGQINFRGSASCTSQGSNSAQRVTCTTNADGQAGVVIKSTLPGLVDVLAENIASARQANGILRDRCIRFFGDGATLPTDADNCAALTGTPPANGGNGGTGGTPGGNTGGGGSTPSGNTGGGSVATVVSLNNNVAPAAKPAAKAPAVQQKAAVKSAKLRKIKGKMRLVVTVKGGVAKKAKVRIRLVYATGRVVNVVRTIRVGKAAVVPNLVVNKHVRLVRVSVLAK